MKLEIRIEADAFPVEVPESVLNEAGDFFAKLDADMDKGWQMSREWVDKPDAHQRCQIVADRILSAFEHENRRALVMYSAYILSRMPTLKVLDISTNGEMQETLFEFE